MSKKSISFICYVTVGLFLLLNLLFDVWDALSYAVSLSVLLDIAYDKYLWRYNPFEKTPHIYGVYHEICHSTYDGGFDYTAKATIRQTLSSITIFEEIKGSGYAESITAALVKSTADSNWKLYYTYRTSPNVSEHDDMHEGTVVLYVKSKTELSGTYFTNRNNPTQGSMQLIKQTK